MRNKIFAQAVSAMLSVITIISMMAPVFAVVEPPGGLEYLESQDWSSQGITPGANECSHFNFSYFDNGDGTHKAECADCGEVIGEASPHEDLVECVCGYLNIQQSGQLEDDWHDDSVEDLETPDGMEVDLDGEYKNLADIPEDELGDGYVTCPHGKTTGESCFQCGELAHNSKNIPLIGYDQAFFDQVDPNQDEGFLLFTIRLVCEHGTADGVYCEHCGRNVDIGVDELPACAMLDSCIHGCVSGEKCQQCMALKEEQGDYELAEGEEWDDPLIYAAEPMKYVRDISYIFNQYHYCIWCDNGSRHGASRVFDDAVNVLCHKDPNGKYHWDYIDHVEGSGTCGSHTTTIVYRCGARANPKSHNHNCTFGEKTSGHSTVIVEPTCQTEGKRQTYSTPICVNCGSEGPAANNKTVSIPRLGHIITGCSYTDSDTHLVNCSGNKTSAHSTTEDHNFQQDGEDYRCSKCDAIKTTVHIDAYTEAGILIKSDLATGTAEVGHGASETVSIQDYQNLIDQAVAKSVGLAPVADQNDSATVQAGGVRLRYICKEIDTISVKDYKDTYYYKSEFEDKGTIVVTYKDGISEEVPLTKDKIIAGFETDPVGEKTLTVNHSGMTTTYDIQVIYQPAKIEVIIPEGYAQSKVGQIVITGDGDFVTFPDGSTKPCDKVKDYLFTENGTFEFTVTGKDKGTDADTVVVDLIDTEAPILTATVANGKVTITSYDDLSGLKTITYFEAADITDVPLQFVGEGNQKTIEVSTDGVAEGIHRFVATDYAGNSRNFDIAINTDAEIDNTPFSMYVPSSISFHVDKEGYATYIPEDTKIYNGSENKPISIRAVNVTAQGDWQLVDYNTDFSQYTKDSSYVAVSINGNPVSSNGSIKINPDDWVIPGDGTMDLAFDIKAPEQTEARELPNVLKINFTGDWYSEDEIVGEKHLITITPNDKVSLSPNVTALYTNNFGKITYLPKVTGINDRYLFVKWVDAATNEEVKVGQVLSNDIVIEVVVSVTEPTRSSNINRSRMDSVFGQNGSQVQILKTAWGNPADGVDISENQDGTVLATLDANTHAGTIYLNDSYLSGSLEGLFQNYKTLTHADLSSFDTRNVTSMKHMFIGCSSLKSLDVSSFDTSKVTNMYGMFRDCSSLLSLDVSNFNTSRVAGSVFGMFGYCSSLTTLDVSGFDTRNITGMGFMFGGCRSLTTLDVSGLDTRNVTDMNCMFGACSSLTTLNLSGLNTGNVTNMSGMFANCTSLASLDLSSFDTRKVTDMANMFTDCEALTSLDLSSFDTRNVSNMYAVFRGCPSLISLNLSRFNTVNVSAMHDMFMGCSSLTFLDLSNFNTKNVTIMDNMFSGCSSLISLDLSSFYFSKAEHMAHMFTGCMDLTMYVKDEATREKIYQKTNFPGAPSTIVIKSS